jgi:hypothetical protein
VISLYEVSGLVPGESMLLRDLVRGGEPVRVLEKRGSQGLRQWDRIATRVIPLRHHSVISGTLMLFDHEASDAGAAFMFTNVWLDAALKAAQGRDAPSLMNSDGEPLEFVRLHFPLQPGVPVQKIRGALAAVPALRQENAGFWNWLAEPGAKPQAPAQTGRGQRLITTMDDGSLVLGTVELKGRRLSLEAKSAARAARGRALLEAALSGLVGVPLTERMDVEQMLAADRGPPPSTGLSPEQERALVHQGLDDHYRRVLDERIPTLGGKSPRAAAKTPKGREKVAAWLKTLENHMARQEPGSPMGGYDLSWMWRELSVEALRR